MKADIKSMTRTELTDFVESLSEKKFRAGQLYQWMHQRLAESFEEMSNLPKSFRERLSGVAELTVAKKVEVRISKLDGTRKYLFAFADGNVIESVLMKYQYGNSVCISSQVGCRMGCRFCASTLDGLTRGLTAAEMLEQVYQIQKDIGERISHIVIMGSGEPFDNYDAVVRFLRLVSSPEGLHISARNLTVSTCGIVPGIQKFTKEGLPVTLALSLHAPNDEVRKTLMPVANRYPLAQILESCRTYYEVTGRRITFEYSLVAGVNDNRTEASALAKLLAGFPCHVNLIPVNPIQERNYHRSGRKQIEEFQKTLEKNGINATIRREMGNDIDGACGQLRKRYLDGQEQKGD